MGISLETVQTKSTSSKSEWWLLKRLEMEFANKKSIYYCLFWITNFINLNILLKYLTIHYYLSFQYELLYPKHIQYLSLWLRFILSVYAQSRNQTWKSETTERLGLPRKWSAECRMGYPSDVSIIRWMPGISCVDGMADVPRPLSNVRWPGAGPFFCRPVSFDCLVCLQAGQVTPLKGTWNDLKSQAYGKFETGLQGPWVD